MEAHCSGTNWERFGYGVAEELVVAGFTHTESTSVCIFGLTIGLSRVWGLNTSLDSPPDVWFLCVG